MEEKEFSPEGTARSAMPAHRTSVVTPWLGYFSPPKAGIILRCGDVALLIRYPTSHGGSRRRHSAK